MSTHPVAAFEFGEPRQGLENFEVLRTRVAPNAEPGGVVEDSEARHHDVPSSAHEFEGWPMLGGIVQEIDVDGNR